MSARLSAVFKKIITTMLAPLSLAMRIELWLSSRDIGLERQRRALATTVDYVDLKMAAVDSVKSRLDLLSIALQKVALCDGLYLEFGVFTGGTINHIASETSAPVYGFDSFEGLPQRWRDGYGKGSFKASDLVKVRPNVCLIKGWFDATLPEFLRQHDGQVAFLHVDCDLYSSTKTIFDLLGERIAPGTVIVFDEYFNYPGWEDGEYKAFQEYISKSNLSYEYISYNRRHEQVAVRIKEKG
jgi:Macrocin-O-methyltransferase (TylF)